MRHSKHSTETIESRFLGTISAFSIRNHHDAMEERAAKENEGGENGVGGYGVECPPCWSRLPRADLDYPVPILPTHLADLACPTPISLLPFIFFLSSSTPHQSRLSFFFLLSILPEFFFCGCLLIFLAWVVVGFIVVVVGWLWDRNFWLWLVFLFLGLIIRGWAVFGCWENEGKSQF